MKKPNHSLNFKIFAAISFALLILFITNPTDEIKSPEKNSILTSAIQKKPTAPKVQVDQNISRAPASIKPTKKLTKDDARVVLGSYDENYEITLINKVSSNWLNLYQKNFKRMAHKDEIKELEIIKKRSVLKVKNNLGRHLEHILVRYKKPDGLPFSFEAYVDSETGQMVQSWNKTQFEFQKPFTFKVEGREYQSN